MEEIPTPAKVRAGDGFYYDEGGNSCAVCVRCGEPIDLQHFYRYPNLRFGRS